MARAREAALSSERPPAVRPRAEAGLAPSLEPPGHASSPVGAREDSSALETPGKAAHPPAWSCRRHLQLPLAKSPAASGPYPSFLWIFPLQGAVPRSRLRTPRSFPGTRRPTDPCGLALLRGGAQRGCFPRCWGLRQHRWPRGAPRTSCPRLPPPGSCPALRPGSCCSPGPSGPKQHLSPLLQAAPHSGPGRDTSASWTPQPTGLQPQEELQAQDAGGHLASRAAESRDAETRSQGSHSPRAGPSFSTGSEVEESSPV